MIVPLARGIEGRLETNVHVRDSESARVDEILATGFASRFARFAVLVVRGPGVSSLRTPTGRALLRRVIDDVRAAPAVTGTASALDADDSLFVGADGGTFVIVGLDPAARLDSILPDLRARTEGMSAALRARGDSVTLLWTGSGPLTVDLRRASADDAWRAEQRIFPLTLVMLVIAFGAVVAAALPLATGALAIAVALGTTALITRFFPLSVLLVNVTTMLGLGLGVDYALLLVSRFREARARGLDSVGAAGEAGALGGETIVLSAGAVLLGFAGLALVPLSDIRSMAIGGALVTLTSVLSAITLLPALLATRLGACVAIGGSRARRRIRGTGWRRTSVWIVRHPVYVLIVAGAPLAAMLWQARRMERRMPGGDWLPPTMESARGTSALRSMHRAGIVQTLRVVIEFPDSVPALSPTGWGITERVAMAIAEDPRVGRVRSLPAFTGKHVPPPTLIATLPGDVLTTFIGRGGRRALIDVLPADGDSPEVPMALVRDLRQRGSAALSGRSDVRVLIGGLPALNADYEDVIRRATPRVLMLVLGGTLVALMIGFRSILVPLKAIVLNLATVGATFGLVVLVFLDGRGAKLIGLSAPLDGIFAAVPLLVFCTVFGLSMDYEVFLVSRVAEATRRGLGPTAAVVEGVRRTGGVITSAGLVMVVVFAGFMYGDFVLMKLLGFALAAAVLLDITLVRLALGPALLVLAGRWNWWPASPRRSARPDDHESAARAWIPLELDRHARETRPVHLDGLDIVRPKIVYAPTPEGRRSVEGDRRRAETSDASRTAQSSRSGR